MYSKWGQTKKSKVCLLIYVLNILIYLEFESVLYKNQVYWKHIIFKKKHNNVYYQQFLR